uniref:Nucleotide-sugar transporter n=1 Tax=Aureoumbra lagunensis TaxID=44058 RepID=A0A7S3JYV7_9STRA
MRGQRSSLHTGSSESSKDIESPVDLGMEKARLVSIGSDSKLPKPTMLNATNPRSRSAYMALALLAVQNCSAVLIMRYTRSAPGESEYNTQTAVVMQELFKTIVSIILVLKDRGGLRSTFSNRTELFKTAVPALLYLLQNNLQYVAVSNLNAATYQVTYQLKILSTALLSVSLLGRQLSRTKWFALLVLTIGVGAVQLSEMSDQGLFLFLGNAKRTSHQGGGPGDDEIEQITRNGGNAIVGLSATLLATLSSGCAGVYFEKILKSKSELSLWQRNTQLGLYSMAIGLFVLFISPSNRASVLQSGFLYGYTRITYINLAVQSFGGLVIAVVIKHADNILKNFATSTSIILSVIISGLFLGQQLSSLFLIGVVLVVYAIFLYAR